MAGKFVLDGVRDCRRAHVQLMSGKSARQLPHLVSAMIGMTELQAKEPFKGRWPGIVAAPIQAFADLQHT